MHIVVFSTASNKKEAERISKALLTSKLVACVNIIHNIKSIFWWQGRLDQAGECLLVIKSRKKNLDKIIRLIKDKHSYDVPEIIALPIIGGNKDYLNWIDESVR
jgi:periplasmic divalent cation tolerance protein